MKPSEEVRANQQNISIADLAVRWSVSEWTIRRMLDVRTLPKRKISGLIRIPLEAVVEYENRVTVPARRAA